MRVFQESQRFTQWWLHILVTLPIFGGLIYMCYSWYVLEKPVDKVGAFDYGEQFLVIALLVATGLLIFIFKLTLEIDKTGLQYKFFPIHSKARKFNWDEIESCYVRKYNPLSEAGGWGYKFGMNGRKIMNIKGTQGIQIDLKDGKKYLFGTQKPDQAQQVINKYFKK